MMYTTVKPFAGFYDMSTESAREANLQQTGLSINDFSEISEKDYAEWCNPPEGYYQVFDENGPRTERIPETDYKAAAQRHRDELLDEASLKITIWQTKLLMGRKLTTDETASLNAWMDYIDAVTVIDTETAPEITWPEKPA